MQCFFLEDITPPSLDMQRLQNLDNMQLSLLTSYLVYLHTINKTLWVWRWGWNNLKKDGTYPEKSWITDWKVILILFELNKKPRIYYYEI